MFGFINIYKPDGVTSHDVVAMLRKITGEKQIGHTGTLDPFATGVLPVCIGKATRLIEYLADDKAYIAKIKFGSATDTYDCEGKIIKTSDKTVTFEELDDVLDCFRGEIEQYPPIYSAKKVNGKKLYEYARNGEEVAIKPCRVCIRTIEILSFDEINNTAEIFIECSKGTYIRSIANDIGEKLSCYAHLTALERVKAGKFTSRQSVQLDTLKNINDVQNNLLSPIDYIDYPKYEINSDEKEKVTHGMMLKLNKNDGICVLTYQNCLLAIARISDGQAKMLKVFV